MGCCIASQRPRSEPLIQANRSSSAEAVITEATSLDTAQQSSAEAAVTEASPPDTAKQPSPLDAASASDSANMTKRLIIVRGVPGSGKTTLARSLAPKEQIFSTDDFFTDPKTGEYKYEVKQLTQAHKWNQERAKAAIAKGITPVVIDNINAKKPEARVYVEAAVEHGYVVEVQEPTNSWSKDPEQLAARNTHGLPIKKLEALVNGWDDSSSWTAESILAAPAFKDYNHRKPAPPLSPEHARWFNAAKQGNLSELQRLLQEDASLLNIMDAPDLHPTTTHFSALMYCVKADAMDCCQWLIERQLANIQATDGSALTYAVYNGRTDLARYLITQGAELNYRNKGGSSALHLASIGCARAIKLKQQDKQNKGKDKETQQKEQEEIKSSFFDCLKLLVLCGADLQLADGVGHTAAQVARDKHLPAWADFLEGDAVSIQAEQSKRKLKAQEEEEKEKKQGTDEEKLVMISYCWTQQQTVLAIRAALKEAKINCWIDVEQMSGSTLSAMADAVERANVVLVCMSPEYQASPNCRLEGEYCIQQRKKIMPIMLTEDFRPKGWLGIILGAKLYYDYATSTPGTSSFSKVNGEVVAGLQAQLSGTSITSSSSSQPTSFPAAASRPVTVAEVVQWAKAAGFPSVADTFKSTELDGTALAELSRLARLGSPLLASLLTHPTQGLGLFHQPSGNGQTAHPLDMPKLEVVQLLRFSSALNRL
eukprot:gb/GEZN01002029.1/.p1 GENE.gb/GEZN01002029.1/~~gb/GEZN01002029.1/.p1  ORF type:complete len:710 (-),score=175.68 gb/GEZN01002029.1/:494-2623(-)